METQKIKDFLTVEEFSQVIGAHPHSIRNMIKKGRLSAFRMGGGERSSYRIPRSEIERLSMVNLDQVIDGLVEQRMKQAKKKGEN